MTGYPQSVKIKLYLTRTFGLMETDSSLTGFGNIDDIKAFRHFFEGFYPSVCVFAQKYLKDAELAEDISQEAFFEFWVRKDKFTDIKAMKGFIYTVTRNKCLNNIKSRTIRENILKDEISSDDYFYEMVLEEETYSILYKSVNNLAPQSQKIVWLSMEGKKNQEIADQLKISVNTVKTLKKNAYKELRLQLKDHVFVLFLISYFLS